MDSDTERKKRQEAEAEDGMSMDYKSRDKKGKIVCDSVTLHGLYVPLSLLCCSSRFYIEKYCRQFYPLQTPLIILYCQNAERELPVPKPATLLSTSATLLVRWKEDNLHFRKWAIVVIYFYRPLVLFMTNCTSSVLQVFHFAFCASVRSFKARVRSFQGIRAHKKRAHSTTPFLLRLPVVVAVS